MMTDEERMVLMNAVSERCGEPLWLASPLSQQLSGGRRMSAASHGDQSLFGMQMLTSLLQRTN